MGKTPIPEPNCASPWDSEQVQVVGTESPRPSNSFQYTAEVMRGSAIEALMDKGENFEMSLVSGSCCVDSSSGMTSLLQTA